MADKDIVETILKLIEIPPGILEPVLEQGALD
jgi:hypothetical protein